MSDTGSAVVRPCNQKPPRFASGAFCVGAAQGLAVTVNPAAGGAANTVHRLFERLRPARIYAPLCNDSGRIRFVGTAADTREQAGANLLCRPVPLGIATETDA